MSIETDPLYIPPEIQPPLGMVYKWGRYKVCGDTDYINISRLEKSGYKPVPIQRHPDLYSDGSVENTISRQGSVLLERTEREQEIFENRLKSVNKILHGPDDSIARAFAVTMIKHRDRYTEGLTTIQSEKDVSENTVKLIEEPLTNERSNTWKKDTKIMQNLVMMMYLLRMKFKMSLLKILNKIMSLKIFRLIQTKVLKKSKILTKKETKPKQELISYKEKNIEHCTKPKN